MTFDPNQTVRYTRSVGKTLLLLSLCIPFILVGYFMSIGSFDGPESGDAGLVLGLFCMAFFGFVGLFGVVQLIRKPGQCITIGPEGLHDPRISDTPLPWRKIEEITVWSSRGASMLMLELDQTYEASLNQSRAYRLYKFANRLVGANGHCLNTSGFAIRFKPLKTGIRAPLVSP